MVTPPVSAAGVKRPRLPLNDGPPNCPTYVSRGGDSFSSEMRGLEGVVKPEKGSPTQPLLSRVHTKNIATTTNPHQQSTTLIFQHVQPLTKKISNHACDQTHPPPPPPSAPLLIIPNK